MLYIACRHHVTELVAEKVVAVLKISASSGPDIAIFKRLWGKWSSVNLNNFDTMTATTYIIPITDNEHSIAFAAESSSAERRL